MAIASTNPATGEVLAEYASLDSSALEERLARAAAAFTRHRGVSVGERAGRMSRAADLLEAEKESLGRLMTLEMGKPITAAVAEAAKCATACRFYAENADRLLSDEPVETDARRSFVR